MPNQPVKERWKSRTGLILTVASGAIGLGNFLRFPGQAVQNGGGAFLLPYIVSFILVGIPVCITEWVMGRLGGEQGHSAPNLFRSYLSGIPLRLVGAIGITIPLLIYVYYVFVEAWCLAYAFDFATGQVNLTMNGNNQSAVIATATDYFQTLVGAKENGSAIAGKIFYATLACFLMNFILVYRGIAKGIEIFAKIAVPLMLICSVIVLVRVLTLEGIEIGLGKMWNPDWNSLGQAKVWISAAGQIFFTLSAGFGIALVFSSYLKRENDVVLSSLSAASLNEFVEVAFGGMITIPVAFLFLGLTVTSFGTFGMGFIALPSVFALMPGGQFFGAIWFFVLFLAALTSSVTMLQPWTVFLEESFHVSRRTSSFLLFLLTFSLSFPILYFNKNFNALDQADFRIGTVLIYILATIQILIFGWVIGAKKGLEEGYRGSHIKLPNFFWWIIKYVTPTFLLVIFGMFLYQNLESYINKMSVDWMIANAGPNTSPEEAAVQALVSRYVFLSIVGVFAFFYFLVHRSLKGKEEAVTEKDFRKKYILPAVLGGFGFILVIAYNFFPYRNGSISSTLTSLPVTELSIEGALTMGFSLGLVSLLSLYCIVKLFQTRND
ncbi:sodium:neurotransmitter symporter family protein [Leptospira inadai serovar Lyme str. 10]|uniref:Sodium:neurotransmitter symporter family protein n=1 Tax=Leptospira inadai serovar Lyme str. 10 TaxID=1049790 RepID=V6HDH8_9LEPT|nr:sodium-dependent transporter [Leptospira inadai]EQA37907.1 sodium:neurotransmitter symporter family protein [Leptospira inadai serovar Lyme str. 10]